MKYAFYGCEEFHSDLGCVCVNIKFTVWVTWWGDGLASFRQWIFYVSGKTTLFPQMFLPVNSKSCVELTLLIIQDDFLQALQCLIVDYWNWSIVLV